MFMCVCAFEESFFDIEAVIWWHFFLSVCVFKKLKQLVLGGSCGFHVKMVAFSNSFLIKMTFHVKYSTVDFSSFLKFQQVLSSIVKEMERTQRERETFEEHGISRIKRSSSSYNGFP